MQVTADQLYTEMISSIMTKLEMAKNVAIWNGIFFLFLGMQEMNIAKSVKNFTYRNTVDKKLIS